MLGGGGGGEMRAVRIDGAITLFQTKMAKGYTLFQIKTISALAHIPQLSRREGSNPPARGSWRLAEMFSQTVAFYLAGLDI